MSRPRSANQGPKKILLVNKGQDSYRNFIPPESLPNIKFSNYVDDQLTEELSILKNSWDDLGVTNEYRKAFMSHLRQVNEYERIDIIKQEKNKLKKFRDALLKLKKEITNREDNLLKLKNLNKELENLNYNEGDMNSRKNILQNVIIAIKALRMNAINIVAKITKVNQLSISYSNSGKWDVMRIKPDYSYDPKYLTKMKDDLLFLRNSALSNYIEMNNTEIDAFLTNCAPSPNKVNSDKIKIPITDDIMKLITESRYVLLQEAVISSVEEDRNYKMKRSDILEGNNKRGSSMNKLRYLEEEKYKINNPAFRANASNYNNSKIKNNYDPYPKSMSKYLYELKNINGKNRYNHLFYKNSSVTGNNKFRSKNKLFSNNPNYINKSNNIYNFGNRNKIAIEHEEIQSLSNEEFLKRLGNLKESQNNISKIKLQEELNKEEEMNNIKNENQQYEQEINYLRDRVQELEQKEKDYELDTENLRNKCKELVQHEKELKSEVEQIQKNNKKKVAELTKKIEDVEKENQNNQKVKDEEKEKEKNEMKKKEDELILKIKDLEKKLKNEEDERKKKEKENEELEKKIKIKEEEQSKLAKEKEDLEIALKEKEQDQSRMENENRCLEDKLNEEIAQKENEIKKKEELAKKLEDFEKSIKLNDEQKVIEFEQKLKKFEQEKNELEREKNSLENEIKKKDQIIKDKDEENQKILLQKSQIEDEKNELNNKCNNLEKDNNDKENQIKYLKEQIEQLNNQIGQLNEKIENLNKENQKLNQENSIYKQNEEDRKKKEEEERKKKEEKEKEKEKEEVILEEHTDIRQEKVIEEEPKLKDKNPDKQKNVKPAEDINEKKEEVKPQRPNYKIGYYKGNISNLMNSISENILLEQIPDFIKRAFALDESIYSDDYYFKGVFPKIIVSSDDNIEDDETGRNIKGVCSFYYDDENFDQNIIIRINCIFAAENYQEQIQKMIGFIQNEIKYDRIEVYLLYDKEGDKFIPNKEAKKVFQDMGFKWLCVVREEKLQQRYIKLCFGIKNEEIQYEDKNNFIMDNLSVVTVLKEDDAYYLKNIIDNTSSDNKLYKINYSKFINPSPVYSLLLDNTHVTKEFKDQRKKKELEEMKKQLWRFVIIENGWNLIEEEKKKIKKEKIKFDIKQSVFRDIEKVCMKNEKIDFLYDFYKTNLSLNFENNYSILYEDIYYNRISTDKIKILKEKKTDSLFFLIPSHDNTALFYIAQVKNKLKDLLIDTNQNVYEKFFEFQPGTQKELYEYSRTSYRDYTYIPPLVKNDSKTIYIPCFTINTHLFSYNFREIYKNVKITDIDTNTPSYLTSVEEFINVQFKPDENINNSFNVIPVEDGKTNVIINDSFIIGIFDNDIIDKDKLPLLQFLYVTKDNFLTPQNYKVGQ